MVAMFASVGCITVNAPPQTPEPDPTSKPAPMPAPTAKEIEESPTPTVPAPAAVTPIAGVPTPRDATTEPTPPPAPPFIPPTTPTLTPASASDHNVVDVVARVKPAVVRLSKRDDVAMGSGVFFEMEGTQRTPYILTNYHVVDGVSRVVIWMEDGQTHDGEVIWLDAQRDLAVVRITCCLEFHRLPVGISLADNTPRDGEEVIAMGFPLGVYDVRTTKGIVASSWYSSQSDRWWIQSDAASNPGNSGGPLLNVDGELVGINTSSTDYTESGRPVEGMNYAVSSITIQRVVPSLSRLNAIAPSTSTTVARATPRATPRPTARPTAMPTPTRTPGPSAPVPVDPRLRIAMAAPTHQVRLPYQTFQSSSGPLHALYDYLVGKDRKTSVMVNTHLASDWSMSSDARQWTFTLKENIPYYQNGKASETYFFSPEDVRHTWLLESGNLTDKAYNTGTYGQLVNSVDDIVVDGNVITWNLAVVHPDLNVYLSEDWTFGMISLAYWNDVGSEAGYEAAPIGTGAFSFVEYKDNSPTCTSCWRGTRTTTARNRSSMSWSSGGSKSRPPERR